jgi:spermidine synthase
MSHSWVSETLFPDIETRYRIIRELHAEKTPFQEIRLVESERFGNMLLLDGVVQTTEKDEFIYHEMMTHVPLMAHPNPERVLIIGGGDGGILREVLRHPSVKRAVLVEIDAQVIEFSKKRLPGLSEGAFDKKQTEIVIGDGAKFVEHTKERFDVVIVDSSDPIGPAVVLFSQQFYANIRGLLTEKGVMARQTGSTILQPEEQREAMKLLRGIYARNALYVFAPPTYIGGFFSATFSSMGLDPLETKLEELESRFAVLKGRTRYYNPGVHKAAFQIPEYVKGIIRPC